MATTHSTETHKVPFSIETGRTIRRSRVARHDPADIEMREHSVETITGTVVTNEDILEAREYGDQPMNRITFDDGTVVMAVHGLGALIQTGREATATVDSRHDIATVTQAV